MSEFKHKVLVVGSGAGGAMAAYTLTKLGHKVLLLEAGRHYDPKTESPMFRRNSETRNKFSEVRDLQRNCP